MTTQRLAGSSIDLDGDGARDEPETQALLTVLKELVDRLSPDSSETIERWEDEAFLYAETPLSHADGAEIDVNIQAGRAFIRMVR